MREVALGPRVVVDVVLVGQVEAQQVEHVGGDVVVEGGDGVGEQQRDPARHGAQEHEELVVDVEQAEHRAGGAQRPQRGDGGVEVGEGGTVHRDGAPAALLPRDRDGPAVERHAVPVPPRWAACGPDLPWSAR